MRSFMKIKPSRNGKINMSFIDIGKSCLSHEFFTSLICLLMLFAKIKFSRKFPNLQYSLGNADELGKNSTCRCFAIICTEFSLRGFLSLIFSIIEQSWSRSDCQMTSACRHTILHFNAIFTSVKK